MEQPKFWILLLTAIIPLIVGSIYYHEKVLGSIWMKESGMTVDKAKQGNMLKIFGFTYVLGVLLSFMLSFIVIHQASFQGAFFGTDFETKGSEMNLLYESVMQKTQGLHRGWKHGILHGIMTSLFLAWPIISINALFEQRGWKYTAVHLGYWTLTLAIMGGAICAYM